MDQPPFYEDEQWETSPTPRGGCFSIVMGPIIILFLLVTSLRFLYGETSRPWEIGVVLEVIPASAHSSRIDNSTPYPTQKPGIAPFFSPSVLFWESDILQWAHEFGLDPNLVATVMQIESCGDPRALSHAGAMGLFQVMPYHFTQTDAPYNPEINASRGLSYLQESLTTHNDIRLGLAGYNGGIGTAAKPENLWPDETQRYAYWGSGIFQAALEGSSASSRLNEWLQAGGTSLCKQAELRLGID